MKQKIHLVLVTVILVGVFVGATAAPATAQASNATCSGPQCQEEITENHRVKHNATVFHDINLNHRFDTDHRYGCAHCSVNDYRDAGDSNASAVGSNHHQISMNENAASGHYPLPGSGAHSEDQSTTIIDYD